MIFLLIEPGERASVVLYQFLKPARTYLVRVCVHNILHKMGSDW